MHRIGAPSDTLTERENYPDPAILECSTGTKEDATSRVMGGNRMVRKFFCAVLLTCTAFLGQIGAVPNSENSFVDVGGAKLRYQECGAANLPRTGIVLLHDGLVHSITWDGGRAPLCAKYHVVRYDRRGYGRSESAKAPFVPEDDLYKIMRQANMERAILVGNSSGGGLAVDFALAHPEMTEALLLIGPVVHGMASSEYFNERGARNSAPSDHGDAKAAAENWSRDRFLIAGEDPRARKQLLDALLQSPKNLSVAGGLEIRPSPPTALRLSELRIPTLVLVGETDIADVFAHSGAIEAAAPLASFEVWKDTGHLIQIQRAAELVSRFNRFVALAERKELPLTDGRLHTFEGRYKMFDRSATVTLKDHRLVLEFPGDPYYWLFPASEAKFFLRTEDTEIEFQMDAEEKVMNMVIHNSGRSVIPCPRLDDSKPQ
jgi:3-oxoadipate enol-lactonase